MTVKIKLARANGALVSYPASAPTIVSGSSIQINTANGLSGGPITTTGTISIIANSGIYTNSSGLFVNSEYISTLTVNSAIYLGTANLQNIQTYITSNAGAAYTNAVSYVDGKSYVNTSQLSSNLANYQTTAGLSANVATLTSNNSSFAYGKTEINLNVNNALTANSSTFLGTANLQNIQTYISSNAGAAYSNAVAYVDDKAYVNTAQLSSNLANYQTSAGLSANVATLASNSATYANASISNTFTIGTSTYYVSSGNVGIGTSAPTSKLDVAGPIRSYNSKFANGATGTNLTLRTNNLIAEVSALTFYSTFPTGLDVVPRRSSDITSGYTAYAWGAEYLSFNVGAGGPNDNGNTTLERVRITGGGNVGIGNTSPDARLTVTGTANISGNVVIGGGLTSANLTTATLYLGNSTVNSTHNSVTLSFFRTNGANNAGVDLSTTTTGAAYLELGGSSGSYIDFKAPFSDDFDQRIQTNSSSIEIIGGSSTSAANNILLSAANVGIGTTTPDARLAVSGTANVSGNVVIGGITTHNANVILGSSGLSANGGFGTAGQLLNSNGTATYWASDKATNAYSNAVSYVDGKSYVNTSQLSSNLANYALLTGATFSGNVRTQQSAQVDGNLVVSGNLTVSGNVTVIGANNLSVVDNMIYLNSNSTTANPDLGFAANYNDGVYRHTGFFRDASDGVWKVFDSYLPEPDASPYIDTTNTSFKIANFQANIVYVGNTTVYSTINTTSFSGTANNTTNAFGKTEINLNVNNALTANSSTFLGTANLSNIQTYISSNASAAYTNAVAYVDGKAYVNTSQLSSNLANYQTTAGLASNVATLTANNTSFVGTISAANVVSNAQLSSNLANYQTTAGLASNVATLASNSATYANASISNTFTVGTSTYFVSNGNVGVGTSAPAGLLHLKSIGPIELILEADSDNITESDNPRILMKQDGGSVVGRIGYANNTNTLEVINEHPASLHLGTANTIRVTADDGGNVGIGTLAPDARLAVSGTANVSGNMTIGGSLTTTNVATIGTSTYFVSNGNVGVGTNTPGYKVSINGGALSSTLGSTANAFQIISTTGNADYINFSKVREAVGSDWTTAAWRMQQVVDVTPHGYIQFNGNGLQQGLTFGTANIERMRIDASGNVGIGNTAPNAKLAITGTANVSGNVVIGGTLTTQSFVANTLGLYNTGTINAASYTVGTSFIANTTTLYHTGTIYSNNLLFQGDGTNAYIRTTTGVLYLGTGSTNYFAVSAAGGGSFIPTADNLYNLGSSTNRWANIYTGDLQLSNEGSEGNDIDQTTGSWTIQEGHENLYLINRKTGKKYMFVLKEV